MGLGRIGYKGGRGEVAFIGHTMAKLGEALDKASGAIGIRPHEATAPTFSAIHGNANELDVFQGHLFVLFAFEAKMRAN